ncbi:MAG: outer membrane beta-barrel protein [Colwelliaceae bacterium]|nr:outer membrane beta-barrel protein [Colwelliaceae bacterium]
MKKISWITVSLYTFLNVFYSASISAQNEFNTKAGNHFNLSLNTEVGHDDNFLFENNDKVATTYFTLTPSIEMQAQFERQLFSIKAISKHTKYQDFSLDGHTNFTLAPKYQYKLAENKALFINSSIENLYERRGTGLTLGEGALINKGDDLEITEISGGYIFGSKESVAKFKIEIGHFERAYQTRRDITYRLDKQNDFVDLSFDYLLSGQSYLATNVFYEKIISKNNSLLDKKKQIALVGVKWQTTEISQLALLVGYQRIQFNESSFADDDSFKWRLNFNWHPIHSTKVAFRSERDFEEANRISDSYRVVDSYDININSDLTDFFRVTAVIGAKQEKIIYQQGSESEDYLFTNIQVNYKRNDWLSFFLRYDYNDLDSSESEYNYQRNSLSIGFNVSI